MVQVSDLSKRYGSVAAVSGVSFEVGQGQVVGLLGPNGAGKTTIMRILTCYHFPSGGDARIGGLSVWEDPVGVKRQVGYVPENAPLYNDQTVESFLRFVSAVRGLGRDETSARLSVVTESCGLGAVLGKRIDDLSKGYRQRAALAQALIHDPAVLILDEPTAGLDPKQLVEIRSLIRELGKTKTIILSTHIMQEVEALCSRVLILKDGKIVAQGSVAEIGDSLRGRSSFDLTIKAKPGGQTAARELAGLPGCSSVAGRPCEYAGAESFTVGVDAATSAELIFDWAVSRGLKLLELQRRRENLEDLFIQLTAEKDEEAE